jgi:hypothetical protein
VLSLQWLNARPLELQQVTGLSAAALAAYEFQALVVSKNSLGSGRVYKAGIPIINARLLHWILGPPHHRKVRTLWQFGAEVRYLPKEGKRYQHVCESPIEFGGIRFLAEGIIISLQALYHEGEDIDLTGLT